MHNKIILPFLLIFMFGSSQTDTSRLKKDSLKSRDSVIVLLSDSTRLAFKDSVTYNNAIIKSKIRSTETLLKRIENFIKSKKP